MLTRLIAVLTLAATLLHSVLGCCWHHDHDVCTKSGHKEIRHPHGGCVSHRHYPDARPGETAGEPFEHEHEICEEPSCVYVVAKHFELPPATMLSVPVMAEAIEVSPTTLDASVLFARTIELPRPAAPALRALLQVWVI